MQCGRVAAIIVLIQAVDGRSASATRARDRFLTDVRMHRPQDLTVDAELQRPLVEAADEQHLAQEPRRRLQVEFRRVGACGPETHQNTFLIG